MFLLLDDVAVGDALASPPSDYAHLKNSFNAEENGFNPYWDCNLSFTSDNSFGFDIHCPATAFLIFTVYDNDVFGDPAFVAFSAIPVECVKPGGYEVGCVSSRS